MLVPGRGQLVWKNIIFWLLVAMISTMSWIRQISCFSTSHFIGPQVRRKTFSRAFSKWNVGDLVSVTVDEESHEGMIHEARGGGWYAVTVRGDERAAWTIKCRSSQLKPPPSPSLRVSSAPTVIPKYAQVFSQLEPERTSVYSDEGMAPKYSPPAPTIYDYDAMITSDEPVSNRLDRELMKQLRHHSSFEKWVVFTDLHCSPSSLDTCLDVLAEVHKAALERKAGVLFLGDFWHHRGSIRVDCLNAVLQEFKSWETPLVMIPGNHDQVTLNGHNHGLTPFENAFRVAGVSGPLVLSYPTKFCNGLFIPHVRDVATMESILQNSLARESKALFVHAEVKGALMNDLIVSTSGVPPDSFPKNKLVYSGHFHKAHTVKSRNVQIEYLGSPYETSLSEAHQPKSLAVLDGDWECIERIPLDVGRRHFRVTSLDELENLGGESQTTANGPRAGDRVVASIKTFETSEMTDRHSSSIAALRDAGVTVEIREAKDSHSTQSESTGKDFDHVPELSPTSTWKTYIQQEIERGVLSLEQAGTFLGRGQEIVDEIVLSRDTEDRLSSFTDLVLDKVSVEGFGPFKKKTSYPLTKRGLVLLKGTNKDGGSDSNGSGKSSLAMAALWALTGGLDPRRAIDGKVSDVVNDESNTARVTLEGTLNGSPFVISRTKTASKSGLVFQLNGDDLTTQSPKETQTKIYEYLGVSPQTLSRTIFFGQHSINELLEATDGKFKDELSLLVPLDVWQDAAALSRSRSRESNMRASEFEGMLKIRSEDIETLCAKIGDLFKSSEIAKNRVREFQLQIKQEETEGQQLSENIDHIDFRSLEEVIQDTTTRLESLQEKRTRLVEERGAEVGPIEEDVAATQKECEKTSVRCKKLEQKVFACQLKLDLGKERLEEVYSRWSINVDKDEGVPLEPLETCPTCHQALSADDGNHSHEIVQQQMEREIEESKRQQVHTKSELDDVSAQLLGANSLLKEYDSMREALEQKYQNALQRWNDKVLNIDSSIQELQEQKSAVSQQMTLFVRQSQLALQREATKRSVEKAQAALDFAMSSLQQVEEDKQDAENRLASIVKQKEEAQVESKTMADLAENFGQRGVQTFVLENVVSQLESLTQSYLDELSDGAQRFSLSLDTGDRILRSAQVCGSDGSFKSRPLATLSGGQWRRCSMALSFGFAELMANRGKLRSSLIVLDEPLTHLDQFGRSKVGDVIRKMLCSNTGDPLVGTGSLGVSTVLMILQDLAAEELEEAFDHIDEVVKMNSQSRVKVDGHASMG